MKDLYYIEQQDTIEMNRVQPQACKPPHEKKQELMDLVCILLPLFAFVLWCLSLHHENVYAMSDLGMVSTFPPAVIISLILVTVSFCLALRQPQLRYPILLLHLALIIFMLYGIQNIVEEEPRFSIVYRHAGYTEYIMRTGTVDPNLDGYFSWPGFFVLSALITKLAGYHDILSFAGWAPVFYNVIYAGPLYMILTVATTNKRLVWLALWFFYLTNWIGQDYFSPQGLNFFLYMVIIAMLLKWFNVPSDSESGKISPWNSWVSRLPVSLQKLTVWLTAPDTHRIAAPPRQRTALLIILLIIFAFVIFSHPLTPFFVIANVAVLTFFRRCSPRWLPIIMCIMNAAWILGMAQAFLAGHLYMVIGAIGQVHSTVSVDVTSRVVQGNPEHTFVAVMRVAMTGLIWLLAALGAIYRFRQGHRDITYILLALTSFPLFLVQQYGGEMLLRIYLFMLPFIVFFAASLFYPTHRLSTRKTSLRMTTIIIVTNLVLLGGFLFTRYGNERMDYMTYDEIAGVRQLYAVAHPNSLFLEGWNDTPWQFQDYEKYRCYSMTDVLPNAVTTTNVDEVIQFIKQQKLPHTYLIFTRSQKVTAESFSGLPKGILDRLEAAMLKSGQFKLLYSNPDAQIFIYTGKS